MAVLFCLVCLYYVDFDFDFCQKGRQFVEMFQTDYSLDHCRGSASNRFERLAHVSMKFHDVC